LRHGGLSNTILKIYKFLIVQNNHKQYDVDVYNI